MRAAAEQNRSACVELLLSYDAKWSIPDNLKITALHNACWEGYETILSLLLQAAQKTSPSQFEEFLDARDFEGKTALADAVVKDRLTFVKPLLEDGASYEIANVRNESVLHMTSHGGKKAMVTLLLEISSKDPDQARFERFLDAQNNKGKTALIDAAETDRASIIKLLLDAGAEYNILDKNGSTALHYCAVRDHKSCVDILLQIASEDPDRAKFNNFLNHINRFLGIRSSRCRCERSH